MFEYVVSTITDGMIQLDNTPFKNGQKPPITCATYDSIEEAKWALKERLETEPTAGLLQLEQGTHQCRGLWLTEQQFRDQVMAPLVRAGCARLPFEFLMLNELPS